ncbi:hypothetical protein B7463_g248, partial [Scytalidium lignicola]
MTSPTSYQDDSWALYDPEFLPGIGSAPNPGLDAASSATGSWRTYAAPTAATNAAPQYLQSYYEGVASVDAYQIQNADQYLQNEHQYQHQHQQHQSHYNNFQIRGQHGVPFPIERSEGHGPVDISGFSNNELLNGFFPETNRIADGSQQLLMPTTALPIRNYPYSAEFQYPPQQQQQQQQQRYEHENANTFYNAHPSHPPPTFQQSTDSNTDRLLYDGRAAVDRGPSFVSSPLTPETSSSDPDTPPAQWVYYANQFTGPALPAYQDGQSSLQQTQYQTEPPQGFRVAYSEMSASMGPRNPPLYSNSNTYQIYPQQTTGRIGSTSTSNSRVLSPPQSAYQTNFKWVQEDVTSKHSHIIPSQPPTYHQNSQSLSKSANPSRRAKTHPSHEHGHGNGHPHEHSHHVHQPTGQWMVVNANPRGPTTVLPNQPMYQQDAQFWNPDPNLATTKVTPPQSPPHAHSQAPLDQPQAPDGSANLKAVTRRPKRRTGPLSRAARDKADFLRLLGACWRCRRYRKSCNDAEVCDTCLTTTEFRLWPPELACRRGQLEDLAEPLMPKHAELAFSHLDMSFEKKPNWRIVRFNVPNHDFTEGDKYQKMLWMTMGTRLFGDEFIELFDIVVQYQKSFKSVLIDAACGHLMAACSFYHAFITTDTWFPDPDFAQILKDFRAHSNVLWKTYLRSALSGRRTDWFPLFLSSILTLFSVVICTDAANAMPISLRDELWDDLTGSIMGLRSGIYIVSLNLLHILTKGIKPWKLPVWTIEEIEQPDGTFILKRNEEGMKLLNQDEAAFDCVMAFRKWLDKYEEAIIHDGKIWFSVKPFTKETLRPLGVLSKILDLN